MITAERYNEIQKARRKIHKARGQLIEAELELSCACWNALQDQGTTLRDVGQILGLSRERTRQIAAQAPMARQPAGLT